MAEAPTTTEPAAPEIPVENAITPDAPAPEAPAVPEAPAHWSRGEGMGFDDDTVGWLENKGLSDPQAAVTSLRELEKKMGGSADMLQKWPESDDKEGFEAIHRRMGKPENVEGYKFDFEEGTAIDPDTLSWFKDTALARNMTNEQAKGMILDWNAEVARLNEAKAQEIDVRNQTEETDLRNTWGTKYDERLDYGSRALTALGLEEQDINELQSVIGPKKLAVMAAKLADTMGEDTIAAHTDTPAFGTSKEQVQNSIDELNGELAADRERYDKYYADHDSPKESTGKDYRRMQQLKAQMRELVKAGA